MGREKYITCFSGDERRETDGISGGDSARYEESWRVEDVEECSYVAVQ